MPASLTTEERSLTPEQLREHWRRSMRRPGQAKHPRGEAAGIVTLKTCVQLVLATLPNGKDGPRV